MFLPGMNYTWIAEQEPRGTTIVDFTSVPQGYNDLAILVLGARSDDAGTIIDAMLYYNEDYTATNYGRAVLRCSSTTLTGGGSQIARILYMSPQDALAPTDGRLWIPDYSVIGPKIAQYQGMTPDIASTAFHTSMTYEQYQHQWVGTDPIIRIRLLANGANWAAPTKVILYGINYGS